MKQTLAGWIIGMFLMLNFAAVFAQDDVTIVAPASEAAEGLDLQVVSELFKETKNLEEFEKALNDPKLGINNLDLDDNGDVDFIRVVEESAEATRVIILQVPLAENEFQDVATIEIEKSGDDQYNMQIHGNEVIYGVDYYMAPAHVHIHTWPIIIWMYRPAYRPYRSTFYFGFYPRWWRPYRPVTVNVYRTRTVHYRTRTTFNVTRTTRVRSVTKVNYKPHSSTRVVKKTHVTGKPGQRGKTTTTTVGIKKTTNKRTGKTTVTAGKKTTTRTKGRKKTTTVKGKRTTRTKGGKKTTTVKGKRTTRTKGGKKTTVVKGKKTVRKKH